jgi:hypothetical protein
VVELKKDKRLLSKFKKFEEVAEDKTAIDELVLNQNAKNIKVRATVKNIELVLNQNS